MRINFLYTCTWLTIIFASIQVTCLGQGTSVLNGAFVKPDAYIRETNGVKGYIDYPPLREADVMYKRRVWQEIDLRQKFNHPLYFPITPIKDRRNLFDVLMHYIEVEPMITAWWAGPLGEDDEFTTSLDPNSKAWREAVGKMEYPPKFDENGELTGEFDSVYVKVKSEEVTKYRIKEDWIWDRARSERYVRILGIAPMMEIKKDGESLGFKPLFWVYYDDARPVLASEDVYNMFNDAQRRTFDDLFQKRYFSSYIIKEDNAFDRKISDYTRGIEAIAEAERIQQELFNLEHDIWHY